MKVYLDMRCSLLLNDTRLRGEKFDYTRWQREYFDSIPDDTLMREAIAYDKAHPYPGKAGF